MVLNFDQREYQETKTLLHRVGTVNLPRSVSYKAKNRCQ